MDKKKLILLTSGAIIITLVAIAITFFALRKSNKAYLNALPQDALALARLDVKTLLDEAKLTKEETAEILQRYSLPEGNATDIGLDLARPVYGFAAKDGNFGLLAAVADADDFTAWCEGMAAKGRASAVTRQRGYSWVVVEEKWLMAFDDDKAVAMGPAVGAAQDQLRTVIAQLMQQGNDESALGTELYKLLDTKDEPLVAAVKPELLPKDVLGAMRSINLKSSAQGLYRLTIEPDDNELEVDVDIVSDDEEVKTELKKLNALMRPIDGRLTDNVHANNALWLAFNTKGEELLKLLRSNASVRTTLLTLNLVVDVDRMIEAIDGDVALEVTSVQATPESDNVRLNFDFKDARLTAQVANTDFLSGASSWGNSFIGVKALSPTEYVVNIEPTPIHFGVKDKTFYIGSERGLVTEGNAYLREQRSDIQGARLYATLNLSSIPLEPISILSKIYPDLNRLDVKMKEAGEFSFTLKASENTNILRSLLKL